MPKKDVRGQRVELLTQHVQNLNETPTSPCHGYLVKHFTTGTGEEKQKRSKLTFKNLLQRRTLKHRKKEKCNSRQKSIFL